MMTGLFFSQVALNDSIVTFTPQLPLRLSGNSSVIKRVDSSIPHSLKLCQLSIIGNKQGDFGHVIHSTSSEPAPSASSGQALSIAEGTGFEAVEPALSEVEWAEKS
jgi:hypothetical protein